eukprot:3839406-Rhodomonas_salina.1
MRVPDSALVEPYALGQYRASPIAYEASEQHTQCQYRASPSTCGARQQHTLGRLHRTPHRISHTKHPPPTSCASTGHLVAYAEAGIGPHPYLASLFKLVDLRAQGALFHVEVFNLLLRTARCVSTGHRAARAWLRTGHVLGW